MSDCSIKNREAFESTRQDEENEKELALLAKAISHPARVRILRILNALHNAGGCLNSGLVSELGLAQSTVSEHLRILKNAGLIIAEPKPPRVCYRINLETVARLNELLQLNFC